MTRSASLQQLPIEMKEALKSFNKADKQFLKEVQMLQEESNTELDIDTESKNTSLSLGYSALQRDRLDNQGVLQLKIIKEKAKAL